MAYPTDIESFPSSATLATHGLDSDPHSTLHGNLGGAVTRTQTWLGTVGSPASGTVEQRLQSLIFDDDDNQVIHVDDTAEIHSGSSPDEIPSYGTATCRSVEWSKDGKWVDATWMFRLSGANYGSTEYLAFPLPVDAAADFASFGAVGARHIGSGIIGYDTSKHEPVEVHLGHVGAPDAVDYCWLIHAAGGASGNFGVRSDSLTSMGDFHFSIRYRWV